MRQVEPISLLGAGVINKPELPAQGTKMQQEERLLKKLQELKAGGSQATDALMFFRSPNPEALQR
ncbi:TPA: hypothetical protein ACRZ6V_001254 [Vibrio harveyi]